MTLQQMFVAFACFFLTTQQITAVVNKAKSVNSEGNTSNNGTANSKVPDNTAAASEQEPKRREAPSETYGLPLGGLDTYAPTGSSSLNLPHPVYGVPDALSNNVVYPAPPPDIPPPISTYGVPLQTYQVSQVNFGSQFNKFIPPSPVTKYLPPIKSKPFISPSFHAKPRIRPHYGPPHKPIFVPKPKPLYGPPRPVYGPPKTPLFVPQKNFKQQSVTILSVPSGFGQGLPKGPESFGVPHQHYGPPEPIPHGPPHPGVPAPPTPPDIKYDGWHPIPGLVSRPLAESHGLHIENIPHGTGDLQLNEDFVPPPIGHGHGHIATSAHSINIGYSPKPQGVSDSYGAPLNAVTGSGAIDSSSVDAHHDDHSLSLGLSAAGINGQNQLSVVKSIGYELFPQSGALSHTDDSYSAPPLNSYSPTGPYAASHSYKINGISSSFGSSIKSHHNHHHSNHGLIPPSGVYGAPNGHFGTPLLTKPSSQYGAPLNALHINPPKHPVIFREPVPEGLIQSIGQHTAHKDAHGIIEHSHSFSKEPTYIPPPIPDITKPVNEEEPPSPSHLYSLPNPSSPTSFQNIAHGSSFSGHFSGQPLTSYTAPLGSIDGSYSLPLQIDSGYSLGHHGGVTVGIDNSLPPVSIDLTSATSNVGHVSHLPHSYPVHDCKSHGSQPLPPLTYGVPSANSYTASLSSLTTNIGGIPSGSYGPPDLQTDYSQKVKTTVPVNSIDNSQGKNYGKALAQNFGPDSELIKSDSIDVKNIPVKGSLGSYTLQIQSADSVGAPSEQSQVSHTQVLNGGLLQSILAAIEQPDRKDTTILGQPLAQLQPSQSYEQSDPEGQHSVTNAVIIPAPVTEATSTTTPESSSEALRLIDDNEIALYFSNNIEGENKNKTEGVLNGQQYGSYVAVKTPDASYSYENLPSNKSQENKD